MVTISSIGRGIPKHAVKQSDAKTLIRNLFPYPEKQLNRLLPIFDHTLIEERQFIVEENWFETNHSLEERNQLFEQKALQYALKAVDQCLTNKDFLNSHISYENIDLIVYVSSTGLMTPSLDAYLMNERPFKETVQRMPLWGLGCAGGAIGLSRAFDWLSAHKTSNALIISCEFCSLTFQKEDTKISNFVGTALFGDGVAAALLVGEASPLKQSVKVRTPTIHATHSYTQKGTTNIMGWHIRDTGFEVIFSKNIPKFVKRLWKKHVSLFLNEQQWAEIDSYIVHPGGPKVLEAMETSLLIPKAQIQPSYDVLKNHGNMSSVTIFYVLYEWLLKNNHSQKSSLLSALGPGFSSELLLLEWT